MKILHILDHSIPLHSGYSFRTRAILGQQRSQGWETAHLTSSKHKATARLSEEVDGLCFHRTPPSDGLIARLPVVKQWDLVRSLERRLSDVIALERPDLLHAHSPSLNGVAAVRVGRRLGLPVVYECRAFWEDAAADHGTSREWGLRYRLSRGLETWVFRNADAVTCICEGLRNEIVERGIPRDKVTVIPNAVDIERFSFLPKRDGELAARLGLEDAIVFGFVGSFYAYEGLALAIRAFASVLAKYPKARLMLVGGGPQDQALRELTQELDLTSRIIFTGRVPHGEVDRYYSLIDILLYPRLPMRLTELVTPLKPLEAMAQGRLVLASDVGGHRELIREGENGHLFQANSEKSLCEAITGLIDDRESWDRQRETGRKFVERERTWEVSVGYYRDVYEGLLDKEQCAA